MLLDWFVLCKLEGSPAPLLQRQSEFVEDDAEPECLQEAERWRGEQDKVYEWHEKEIARFLDAAHVHHDKAGQKQEVVRTVQAVQAEVLSMVLGQAEGKRWEQVLEFLSRCLQSVNSRPVSHKFSFIHYAVAQGHQKALQQLLQLRADPGLRSGDGRSPWQIARDHGRTSLAEYLQSLEDADDADAAHESRPTLGFEALGPPAWGWTHDTVFESRDGPGSVFGKVGEAAGWDAHATTCSSGVTAITVSARQCCGPLCFGMTSDHADDHKFQHGFRVLLDAPAEEVSRWGSLRSARSRKPGARSPPAFPRISSRPEDSTTCELSREELGTSDAIKMAFDDGEVKVFKEEVLVKTFKADPGCKFFAKAFIYNPDDSVGVRLEPLVRIAPQLRFAVELRGAAFKAMLKSVLVKLLPGWLREECDGGEDPTDYSGHMMYFVSLVVVLLTRAWTAEELAATGTADRAGYRSTFNHEWAADLERVLKTVWDGGGAPRLERLRAAPRARIPGSGRNRAVLALALLNVLRPQHEWVAWTCWRRRGGRGAAGRTPRGGPAGGRCVQLHSVCCHLGTNLWADPAEFWDRDPHHMWTRRYPDPDLLSAPLPQSFSLAKHTEWLQRGGPAGSSGYNCPMRVCGQVPPKLRGWGVWSEDGSPDDVEADDDGWEEDDAA